MSYINIVFLLSLCNHLLFQKIKGDYMQAILDDLKRNEILSSYQIHQLQSTIKEKYPTSSKEDRAIIFAKYVHQVIDHILLPFGSDHQKSIKSALLNEAVQRETFSINAYDICKTCIDLKLTEGEALTTFTNWLNKQQSKELTPKEVASLEDLIRPLESVVLVLEPTSQGQTFISNFFSKPPFWTVKGAYGLLLGLCMIAIAMTGYYYTQIEMTFSPLASFETALLETTELPLSITLVEKSNHLQKKLQYKEVNKNALQHWLKERNSLLSEDPYFNQIMATAKDFNINPLLLFAITGQEQGFVPKHHTNALEIASNPFNVYGSWQDYNTSIEDSSRIAARTIINLSKGCPEDADPIMWLNQNYAEDPNWYKGVTALLNQLEKVAIIEPTH